jgi:hypothetical protein
MMRLALTMPFLALTLAPCFAQSDDFNPYQAVLDGMTLVEAEPLIVAAYGEIGGRYAGIAKPYDGGPILLLGAGSDVRYASFLFCDGVFAGLAAPVTPAVAAKIINPLTIPGMEIKVYADDDDAITIFGVNDELMVTYQGIGTKSSWVSATYPANAMLRFNFADRCATMSN